MTVDTVKLHPGSTFPIIEVNDLKGNRVQLGQPASGTSWQMVVVYRGKHCPLCTQYLNQLDTYVQRLNSCHIDVVAVSGDSQSQLSEHLGALSVGYPIYYGLTEAQMKTLGLYISIPRSEQEADHHFAEPGLFVVNENRQLHAIDISNNPFSRPDLDPLVSGLEWIRNPENHYPIRGTAL